MPKLAPFFLTALLSLACLGPLWAQQPVSISLPGNDGKDHAPLTVLEGKKAVVLLFVSPYCPTANTFMPEIGRIEAAYSADFTFYLIHSDKDTKTTDAYQQAEMNKLKSVVLMDTAQDLAKHTGAKITPECVVVGSDGRFLYQGRINDWYIGPTKKQRKPTTSDLKDALDAIKKGTPVTNDKTEAVGCKISGI